MLGDGRHASVASVARWLEVNPNLPSRQREIASVFTATAGYLLKHLKDGPELTAGLRKLLEAKDACVRQSLADEEPRNEWKRAG